MAEIYLARLLGMQGFQKHLVLKRILPHLAANETSSGCSSTRRASPRLLNHPNMAQILDSATWASSYFFAMEYLHGEDLRRMLQARRSAVGGSR